MKNINDFYKHIHEGMNYAPLYHILDDDKLTYLLKSNTLTGYNFSGVSFTRNKMLNGYLGSTPTSVIKLEIDAEKLSHHYQIKPVVYKARSGERFTNEREEYCAKPIKNAIKYINKVILVAGAIDNMVAGRWGSDYFAQYGRENIQDIIKKIKGYCEQYNLPLYVQYGSKIVKDDEYVESIITRKPTKERMGYRLFYRGSKRVKVDKWGFTVQDVLIDALNGENLKLERDTLVIGLDYPDLTIFTDGVKASVKSLYDKLIPAPIDDREEEYILYRMTFKYEEEDILDTIEEFGKPAIKLKTAYMKDATSIIF